MSPTGNARYASPRERRSSSPAIKRTSNATTSTAGPATSSSSPPSSTSTRTPRAQRYLTHDNDPDNADYRRFLSRLWDELRPRLTVGARGLDYGAGPGPALAAMIEEDGYSAALYDPLFHPDETVLADTYDFITCTETVEHFATPRADFLRLYKILAPGAYLGIMTDILEDIRKFPDWYYHRDPTHVAFYTRRTFHWIAAWLGFEIEFPRPRVLLLRKPL